MCSTGDIALSTASSFRAALPKGPITFEKLRDALPYENEIVVCTMDGESVLRLMDYSRSRAGSDSEAYFSGLLPQLTRSPNTRIYRVAATDYLANVAYRDVFKCEKEKTGKRVRESVKASLSP